MSMSNVYVITIELTKPFDDELSALVPAETQRVHELAAAGLIQSGFLRADLQGAYLIMQADSDAKIHAALDSLPMRPFMKLQVVPCRSMGVGEG
jgi:muconolactone delta-isomerase